MNSFIALQVRCALENYQKYLTQVEPCIQQQYVVRHSSNKSQICKVSLEYLPSIAKIYEYLLTLPTQTAAIYPSLTELRITVQEDLQCIELEWKSQVIPIDETAEGLPLPIYFFTRNHHSPNLRFKIDKKSFEIAAIFSTKLNLQIFDASAKKTCILQWQNNMKYRSKQEIAPYDGDCSRMRVVCYPDLQFLQSQQWKESSKQGTIRMMEKRAYDIAGTLSQYRATVSFNGVQISFPSFRDYIMLYDPTDLVWDEESSNSKCQLYVAKSANSSFEAITFINGAPVSQGTHISHILHQLNADMLQSLKTANKRVGRRTQRFQIHKHIRVFANLFIDQAAYDDWFTRTSLTSGLEELGREWLFGESLQRKMQRKGYHKQITQDLRRRIDSKILKKMKSTPHSRHVYHRYNEAWRADSADSSCTLILTGQLSAQVATQISELLGREAFGVLPIHFRLPNARESSWRAITQCRDYKVLINVLGLVPEYEYKTTERLRYKRVFLLFGRDSEGVKTIASILNLLAACWPSLLKMQGFLQMIVFPRFKAQSQNGETVFFTKKSLEKWVRRERFGFTLKQYDHVCAFSPNQVFKVAGNLEHYLRAFHMLTDEDRLALKIAFGKQSLEKASKYLQKGQQTEETELNYDMRFISIKDFINAEYVRTVKPSLNETPSAIDGFTSLGRTIFSAVMHRAQSNGVSLRARELCELARSKSGNEDDKSILSQILRLLSRFPGSNNVPLLEGQGQLPSRHIRFQGGTEARVAEHIEVRPDPIIRFLFPEADEHILKYSPSSQAEIPIFFVPVLPLIFLNGFATDTAETIVYPSRVAAVIAYVRDYLSNHRQASLQRGYERWKGSFSKRINGEYESTGQWYYDEEDQCVEIFELPIGECTRDYRRRLEERLKHSSSDPGKELYSAVIENHRNDGVHFTISFLPGREIPINDIPDHFELLKQLPPQNLLLLDRKSERRIFQGDAAIMKEFFEIRIAAYSRRKAYLQSLFKKNIAEMSEVLRFTNAIAQSDITLECLCQAESAKQWLRLNNYAPFEELPKVKTNKSIYAKQHLEESCGYGYLLKLPMLQMSLRSRNRLQREKDSLETELLEIGSKSEVQMWMEDIAAFERAWNGLNGDESTANLPAAHSHDPLRQLADEPNEAHIQIKKYICAWSESEEESCGIGSNKAAVIPMASTRSPTLTKSAKTGEARQQERGHWYESMNCSRKMRKASEDETIQASSLNNDTATPSKTAELTFGQHKSDFLQRIAAKTQSQSPSHPSSERCLYSKVNVDRVRSTASAKLQGPRTRSEKGGRKRATETIEPHRSCPASQQTRKSNEYDLSNPQLELLIMNENVKFNRTFKRRRRRLSRRTKSSFVRPISLIEPVVSIEQ